MFNVIPVNQIRINSKNNPKMKKRGKKTSLLWCPQNVAAAAPTSYGIQSLNINEAFPGSEHRKEEEEGERGGFFHEKRREGLFSSLLLPPPFFTGLGVAFPPFLLLQEH